MDPTGMDWVQKEYEDRTEYYYDRNVKSQEVINADIFLARYNYLNMTNPHTPILDRARSALTAPVFTIIAGYKSLLNYLKNEKK